MLHRIHNELTRSSSAYASWHKNEVHLHLHWSAFIAVALLVSAALLNQISISFSEINRSGPALAISSVDSRKKANNYVDPAQDHILLRFKSGISQSEQEQVLKRQGITLSKQKSPTGMIVGLISPSDAPEEVVQRILLSERQNISAVTVDYIGVVY